MTRCYMWGHDGVYGRQGRCERHCMSEQNTLCGKYSRLKGDKVNSKQLWGSILQQAVSGKLVKQFDSEPAVAQIGAAPAPEEAPFEIPEKWKWVQLSGVVNLINGDRGSNYPSKSKLTNVDTGYPFVSAGNLENNEISSKSLLFMTEQQCQGLRSGHILSGDFLLCIRGSLGKFAFARTDGGAIASSLVILRVKQPNHLLSGYLWAFLDSEFFREQISLVQNGTCQPNLGAKVLAGFLLPVPPIAEQRRIVDKLEELKPLVERFGEAQDALVKLEAEFPRSLKASVLQYAVSGQLVPQSDTEPAVEQIGIAPAPEKVPFEIPEKWKWVQAKCLGDWKSGQTPSRTTPAFWTKGTVRWLKSGEITDGLIANIEELVTEQAVADLRLRVNPQGSVVIALYGATAGKVGILKDSCVTNQACCACLVNEQLVLNWYLFYALLANRNVLLRKAEGSAQSNLSKEKVVAAWIPIPPLEEQHRIVAKLDEILADVEKMERLTSASK